MESKEINLGCFSRAHRFHSLHGENFMVMASEQRKVFVEILKGSMPQIHNENVQGWFLGQ